MTAFLLNPEKYHPFSTLPSGNAYRKLGICTNRKTAWGTHHVLSSKILNEDRELMVILPEGYEESKHHYPVLLMTDSKQNIRHTMGATNLLSRTGDAPPVIIVGLASKNRMLDFTPTQDKGNPESKSGGGCVCVSVKYQGLPAQYMGNRLFGAGVYQS